MKNEGLKFCVLLEKLYSCFVKLCYLFQNNIEKKVHKSAYTVLTKQYTVMVHNWSTGATANTLMFTL